MLTRIYKMLKQASESQVAQDAIKESKKQIGFALDYVTIYTVFNMMYKYCNDCEGLSDFLTFVALFYPMSIAAVKIEKGLTNSLVYMSQKGFDLLGYSSSQNQSVDLFFNGLDTPSDMNGDLNSQFNLKKSVGSKF